MMNKPCSYPLFCSRCLKFFCAVILLTAFSVPTAAASDTDTIAATQRTPWVKALFKGKTNPKDTTVAFPRFVKFCLNTVNLYKRVFNTYDPNYIANINYKFRLTLKNVNWIDGYDCSPYDEFRMTFLSGAASSVGLYLSFLGITGGYSVDVDRIVGGHPTYRRWQIGLSTSRFNLEYYNMSNDGKMDVRIYDKSDRSLLRIKKFGGVHRRSWGLSGYYIFNNLRYAQATAYGYSKRQLRSAGSWLAGFDITHQNISVVGAEMDPIFRDDDTEESLGRSTVFNYTDYCVSGGYGYNWALGHRWVINGMALLYAGPKYAHTAAASDGGHTFFGLNGKVRMAVTYTGNRFFAGLQGIADAKFFNTGSYRYRNFMCDLSLNAGVRF